jgi:hypothetical protein
MQPGKKITSLNWWNTIKTVFRFAAYFIIIIEGIQAIIFKIEEKDGIKPPGEAL